MRQDHLQKWLSTRTGSGEPLKIDILEKKIGCPERTLEHWIKGRRGLPKKYLPLLMEVLEDLSYKPE